MKVDLHARTVVGSAPVSAPPVQLYLTPDEATVLSADQGTPPDKPGHTVSVIDAAAMTVRSSVPTGAGPPHGVVVDTSGTRAWVTNTYDNTVSAINLGSMSVVATVAVGAEPSGISYSPPRPPAAFGATATLNIPPTPPTNDADRAQQPPPDQHGH